MARDKRELKWKVGAASSGEWKWKVYLRLLGRGEKTSAAICHSTFACTNILAVKRVELFREIVPSFINANKSVSSGLICQNWGREESRLSQKTFQRRFRSNSTTTDWVSSEAISWHCFWYGSASCSVQARIFVIFAALSFTCDYFHARNDLFHLSPGVTSRPHASSPTWSFSATFRQL